jgi:hypothetical protein
MATPSSTNSLGYRTEHKGVVAADTIASGIEELQAGIKKRKVTTSAVTDTATLTTAQILSGHIVGTPTAAATYTLPTGTVFAAAVVAAGYKTPAAGDSWDFSITNAATTDTYDITVAGASGMVSQSRVLKVLANDADGNKNYGSFQILCTAANTFTVHQTG